MTIATRAVNPWRWQDALNFSQAVDVRGAQRLLYCAGQTSVDADGQLLYAGDMARQVSLAFDNLEAVLKQAGLSIANVVRLNYYTTDVRRFFDAASPVVADRLKSVAAKPSGTLLGVAALFHPDALIEIEATAAE